ncbi:hypothetical protein DC31_00885 [Microbacterium sp. CH12i]|uniref:hypothetical protein n=1 Tax=Microbacterium sp. CH12i TaxID=1479651 RepID=UPI000461904F|nr:hypothetical protein [Microbacterium sp. CH12i]KDA07033.1 hypothetical protein DC31_00885 [Microbacterium sp. CH12i]
MTRPHRSPAIRTTAALLAIGAALTFVGCAKDSPEDNALPPVIVDITKIDGSTVQVAEGNVVDFTGDDKTFTDWTAKIQDPEIVEFTPGKDDGSAQFNPGLDALSVGETEVTLDNSTSGDSVTFTVEVTEPVD